MSDIGHSESEPVAPPVSPAHPARPPRPKWAVVLGIISIVMASLGLLANGISTGVGIWGVLQDDAPMLLVLLQAGLPLLVSVWLLTAGILLLRGRRRGAWMHVAYGISRLVLLLLQVGAMLYLTLGAMAALNNPLPRYIMLATGGVALAVLALYPAFVLAWFLRRSIRHEVRQWPRYPRTTMTNDEVQMTNE